MYTLPCGATSRAACLFSHYCCFPPPPPHPPPPPCTSQNPLGHLDFPSFCSQRAPPSNALSLPGLSIQAPPQSAHPPQPLPTQFPASGSLLPLLLWIPASVLAPRQFFQVLSPQLQLSPASCQLGVPLRARMTSLFRLGSLRAGLVSPSSAGGLPEGPPGPVAKSIHPISPDWWG